MLHRLRFSFSTTGQAMNTPHTIAKGVEVGIGGLRMQTFGAARFVIPSIGKRKNKPRPNENRLTQKG